MRFTPATEQNVVHPKTGDDLPEHVRLKLLDKGNTKHMSRTIIDPNDLKPRKLGLTRQEKRSYSLTNALRGFIHGGPGGLTGLERELHDELSRGGEIPEKPSGFLCPIFEISEPDIQRRGFRDSTVTSFGTGGALVGTEVRPPVIPVLRNLSVCEKLGMRTLTGLQANLALPRQTASITPGALGEQTAAALSTQSLDQVLVTPHRCGSVCNYSRQLVLQSDSVDIEDFLREDMVTATAIQVDRQCLWGQGGAEATGLLQITGIGSIEFGGSATWASLVAFENSLATANALGRPGSRIGWAVSPSTKSRWKVIAKTGVGVTTTVPIFLWGDSNNGSEDGVVNGYQAVASNQLSNNNFVYFGNWADAIICFWGRGGVADIVIDPYKLAETATIRIVVNIYFDLAVLHAQSFCVSMDSGAQ